MFYKGFLSFDRLRTSGEERDFFIKGKGDFFIKWEEIVLAKLILKILDY